MYTYFQLDSPFLNGIFSSDDDWAFWNIHNVTYDTGIGMVFLLLVSSTLYHYIMFNTHNETVTRPTDMGDLIIANENDCMQLVNGNYWSTIIVNAHTCLLSDNITITDNPYLDRLLFYEHSLLNVSQLTISNHPYLNSILFEDYSFENTYSLILKSKLLIFTSIFDLPLLQSIHFGHYTFVNASIFELSSTVHSFIAIRSSIAK